MKKSFLTGLVILLPLAVTIAVIVFIVNLLTEPFIGMVENTLAYWNLGFKKILFLNSRQVIHVISQILILVGLFLVTLFLGFLARLFLFHTFLKIGDFFLARIPLINKVYKTSQEIIKTLVASPKNSFKQVVMAPFPNADVFALGLIAGPGLTPCQEAINEPLVSVFIPTTPNPTSGYLLMFKKEELRYIDMKVEDALKYIISCGVVTSDQATDLSSISSPVSLS